MMYRDCEFRSGSTATPTYRRPFSLWTGSMYVTKQNKSDIQPSRDRPECELTPEMIEAGASRFAELRDLVSTDFLVSEVYRAMRGAWLESLPAGQKSRE